MSEPVFDDNDKLILEQTLQLRTRMLGVFAKKSDADLPTKPSEMLAIAQLAGSIDKTVIDRAKLRADQQNAHSQEKDRALFLELMSHLHQNPRTLPAVEVLESATAPEYQPNQSFSLVEGELVRREDNIDIDALTK